MSVGRGGARRGGAQTGAGAQAGPGARGRSARPARAGRPAPQEGPPPRRAAHLRFTIRPHILRASSHRPYELLVRNTSSSESAKEVRPKGALVASFSSGKIGR